MADPDPTALPTPEQAASLLRGRRTVSLFQPETPPASLVKEACEIARWAPNHRMTQPWRFYLLGEQTQQRIVALNTQIITATKGEAAAQAKRKRWQAIPGWLLVSCVKSDNPLQAREDYAACACAVQNAMLYLWSQGVGCKWTTGGITRDPRFYEVVDVDARTEEVVSLLWYGYPAHQPKTKRKPLDEHFFTRD